VKLREIRRVSGLSRPGLLRDIMSYDIFGQRSDFAFWWHLGSVVFLIALVVAGVAGWL
jgi:hypothetical protein